MTEPKPAELIRAARNIIAAEGRWTRDEMARDAASDACPVNADRARSFCAIGAIHRAYYDATGRCCASTSPLEAAFPVHVAEAFLMLGEAIAQTSDVPNDTIMRFNDRSTHADVVDLFDTAITLNPEV